VSRVFILYNAVNLKGAAANSAAQSQARRRRRRSDAEQNTAAILRAAITALNAQPEASIEDIARAAGVSRQTVYAHFPSRESLLDAVIEQATAEVTAAFDAAGLDEAPPAQALTRLLDVAWAVTARYAFLWHLPEVSQDQDRDRHGPVIELMQGIIRRGQDSGELDRDLSPAWLVAAVLALGRAAEDEVRAGRMTVEEATSVVHRSFLRLFGLRDPGSR
jgi:AcrR family transcriptional regulator